MDWESVKTKSQDLIKKYRYLFMILLVGILFMTIPQSEQSAITQAAIAQDIEPNLQTSLEEILSYISGAGTVKVLLTQSKGEEIVFQSDENTSPENVRRDTVLITNSARENQGLVKQTNPPQYQGAIIVCQGAESANIRLQIVNAVMSVTGLTSDHITVLKMK